MIPKPSDIHLHHHARLLLNYRSSQQTALLNTMPSGMHVQRIDSSMLIPPTLISLWKCWPAHLCLHPTNQYDLQSLRFLPDKCFPWSHPKLPMSKMVSAIKRALLYKRLWVDTIGRIGHANTSMIRVCRLNGQSKEYRPPLFESASSSFSQLRKSSSWKGKHTERQSKIC